MRNHNLICFDDTHDVLANDNVTFDSFVFFLGNPNLPVEWYFFQIAIIDICDFNWWKASFVFISLFETVLRAISQMSHQMLQKRRPTVPRVKSVIGLFSTYRKINLNYVMDGPNLVYLRVSFGVQVKKSFLLLF